MCFGVIKEFGDLRKAYFRSNGITGKPDSDVARLDRILRTRYSSVKATARRKQ